MYICIYVEVAVECPHIIGRGLLWTNGLFEVCKVVEIDHTLKKCNIRQHVLYPSTSYLCLSIMPARQPRVRMYASTYDLCIHTYILYRHVVYVRVVRLSYPYIHILHNTYIKNRVTELEKAQHDHGMRVTNSTLEWLRNLHMNESQNLCKNESRTLHIHELRTLHRNESRTLHLNDSRNP